MNKEIKKIEMHIHIDPKSKQTKEQIPKNKKKKQSREQRKET